MSDQNTLEQTQPIRSTLAEKTQPLQLNVQEDTTLPDWLIEYAQNANFSQAENRLDETTRAIPNPEKDPLPLVEEDDDAPAFPPAGNEATGWVEGTIDEEDTREIIINQPVGSNTEVTQEVTGKIHVTINPDNEATQELHLK